MHGLGDHVAVLQAGAGVEQDDAVAGLKVTGGEEAIVGSGSGGASGGNPVNMLKNIFGK